MIFHSLCRTALLDKPSAGVLQLFPSSCYGFLGGAGGSELRAGEDFCLARRLPTGFLKGTSNPSIACEQLCPL